MKTTRGRTAALIASLVAVPAALAALLSGPPSRAAVTHAVYLTMYGWPDNDPPGPAIAYPKSDGYPTVHNQAGGDGSYADPVTVAVAKGYLQPGTRVYLAAYHKYAMVEDECASCTGAWIDVWVGGQGVATDTVLAAEDKLTIDQAYVTFDPGQGLPVDTRPMLQLAGVAPAPAPVPAPPPPVPPAGQPVIARILVHGSTVAFLWRGVPGASRYEWGVLRNGRWEHSGSASETWLVGYYAPRLPREFRSGRWTRPATRAPGQPSGSRVRQADAPASGAPPRPGRPRAPISRARRRPPGPHHRTAGRHRPGPRSRSSPRLLGGRGPRPGCGGRI